MNRADIDRFPPLVPLLGVEARAALDIPAEERALVAHAEFEAQGAARVALEVVDQRLGNARADFYGFVAMMDGKLLLVSNAEGLTAQNVIQRYKSLADIERGFKVLKSEIEIGPVYHRLPERIRAHASICFMALILHRVMRSRLKAADAGYTPERALEQLQRIQHHRVRLNGGEPVAGVSTLSTEQNEVLHALGIERPAAPEQLALL